VSTLGLLQFIRLAEGVAKIPFCARYLSSCCLPSSYSTEQGSPNCGPRTKPCPWSHFIWPANPFCQQ